MDEERCDPCLRGETSEETVAEYKCVECDEFLCKRHLKAHNRYIEDHTTYLLADGPPKPPKVDRYTFSSLEVPLMS